MELLSEKSNLLSHSHLQPHAALSPRHTSRPSIVPLPHRLSSHLANAVCAGKSSFEISKQFAQLEAFESMVPSRTQAFGCLVEYESLKNRIIAGQSRSPSSRMHLRQAIHWVAKLARHDTPRAWRAWSLILSRDLKDQTHVARKRCMK